MEQIHAAHAHRTERVAVIALGQRDELALVGLAALLPVLEGHLQRNFHRGAAAVGIEHLGEAGLAMGEAGAGRTPDQLGGQLDGRRRSESQQRGVRHVLQLQLDRAVDLVAAVAVDVHPQ